jgi:pilus assembly protein TadC
VFEMVAKIAKMVPTKFTSMSVTTVTKIPKQTGNKDILVLLSVDIP